MQMPPVFDHRRPASPVFTNLREQAVDIGNGFFRAQNQIAGNICPDLHRQVFAGNQILKTSLLTEALSLAEIVQRQRHRIGPQVLPQVVGKLKFGGMAGLVAHRGAKCRFHLPHALTHGPHQQLLLIDDLHGKAQAVGIRRAHGIAAVIAHHGAILQTAGAGAQIVKLLRRVSTQGLFAVKHGVHAAARRVVLHHPMTVPQLRLGLRFRVEPSGGGIRVSLAVGGHIDQCSLLVILRAHGIARQFLDALPAAFIDIALARRLEPGHPVLHGGKDHLRPAVQFRLADVLLHFGNGDHGQGRQNDDDHDRHHHFQQRKAVCIVPFCPVFHGIPFSFRRFCAGHFKMTSK